MRNKNPNSPLVKHVDVQHGGQMPKYKLTIVSRHRRAMERQNAEGVNIILGQDK